MKKKFLSALSVTLCGVMAFSTLAGCTDPSDNSSGNNPPSQKKDAITIMTEELSGTFNPFYATSGTDMDVVGMTQVGMLSTDKNGNTVAGDEYPTVVKDFMVDESDPTKTVYTFVIKNGLKFSDGVPLTMEDIMFNIYEYLDPVYTGSSTMYSIDIQGLQQYRLQKNYSGGNDEASENLSRQANTYAKTRIQVLKDLYELAGDIPNSDSFDLDDAGMRAAIAEYPKEEFEAYGYKDYVPSLARKEDPTEEEYRAALLADYELTLDTFKDELEADFKAAKESYDLETAPWKDWKEDMSNDIFKFFLYEGYITFEYADDLENRGKKDKTKIESFSGEEIVKDYSTMEDAINRVYTDTTKSELNRVLTSWGTAGTLLTRYSAEAMDVLLNEDVVESELRYPNISGVVSLGHPYKGTELAAEPITEVTLVDKDEKTGEVIGSNRYKVAQEHNEDGTPKNADEYDVLQITINGQDPKAIYNFGFTVAPAHYYGSATGDGSDVEIDIVNNKFGVPRANSAFQQSVIQSLQHLEIPVGAGPYKATNANNSDNPKGTEFWSSNIVYFKANENFVSFGPEFEVKTEKLRMQVVSSTNALDKLANGEIDYVTPQFTPENAQRLNDMSAQGFKQLSAWQLGYGYIGINAGKVDNIYLRRAIMAAMNTDLAKQYYVAGTCRTISWPMSTVSWAYPWEDPDAENKEEKIPGSEYAYTQWEDEDNSTDYPYATAKIQELMRQANASKGDDRLDITFTIAGASITEHPTYNVFKQAAEILNDLGWEVEVVADSQALTKLSTGSLEVWAAAWGSTIDPDMYQVYHKNSTATSVLAWGYREIRNNPNSEEYGIITELSEIIDAARETTVREGENGRIALYEQAMRKVLELAVELPVYQRSTLYAYNSKTITGLNEDVNPYSTPLEKIWEVELVK